jgi:amidase
MKDMLEWSATELSRAIHARKVAPSEVMALWLTQVDAANGPLNAIVSRRDPDALMAEARALDDVAPTGWLHGIPFAIKDLVATSGLRTTWGSPLFADHVPVGDDLVATRLRARGAVIAAKTNVPEWGQGSHSFNPVFGVTRNPYDPTRSAGGSSGGAAAALAARMAWVADGSDMMGSLRNPAAFCNVYGFRPTWGLVPQDAGGDTYLDTLSTEGPMARTVEDVARLLMVLAGENPEVPFPRSVPDVLARLDRGARGLRIGWLGDWGGAYPMEPGILGLCETALRQLEDLGAVVEPLPPPFPAGKIWSSWVTLRAMLNAGGKRALAEDPEKRALTKPETLWEIEHGMCLTLQAVHEASVIRSRWHAHAAHLFQTYDALVLPAAQVWPFPADWRWPRAINRTAMDTYHRWMEVVVPASLIGLPALSVPVGFSDGISDGLSDGGLPMGMQIIGRSGDDAGVLAIGQAWHRATEWPQRRPPLAAAPVSR